MSLTDLFTDATSNGNRADRQAMSSSHGNTARSVHFQDLPRHIDILTAAFKGAPRSIDVSEPSTGAITPAAKNKTHTNPCLKSPGYDRVMTAIAPTFRGRSDTESLQTNATFRPRAGLVELCQPLTKLLLNVSNAAILHDSRVSWAPGHAGLPPALHLWRPRPIYIMESLVSKSAGSASRVALDSCRCAVRPEVKGNGSCPETPHPVHTFQTLFHFLYVPIEEGHRLRLKMVGM
nr:hypothetical protein CFP56_31627 [Quercus suber]